MFREAMRQVGFLVSAQEIMRGDPAVCQGQGGRIIRNSRSDGEDRSAIEAPKIPGSSGLDRFQRIAAPDDHLEEI